MRLIRPSLAWEAAHAEFISEWADAGEVVIPGAAGGSEPYAQWLAHTHEMETRAPAGMVTEHLFFYVDEDAGRIVGAVAVRHTLNEGLLRSGGHIGYGVRPSGRRKGHATAILREALIKARALGIDRALVVCNRENTGSARTILKNGGVLENEIPVDDHIVQRYWIDL